MGMGQTIGFLAFLTIEMTVHFFYMAAMVTMTEAIFFGAAPIFNFMQEVMFAESIERTEDSGLVHRVQFLFQIGQAEGVFKCFHGLVDEQSHGSQSDFMTFQYLFSFTHDDLSCL